MSALRKLFSAVALAAPLVLAASMTAHADPLPVSDGVVVVGSGTITPGLPCSPCAIDFNFNAVVVGDDTAVYTGCNYHANSVSEDELGGSGTGTLSGCPASGTVNYDRNGVLVTVSGNVTVNGEAHSILVGVCVFVPTSVLPTTSFAVVCGIVLVDDPPKV
jgi:hypothetical protein